MTWLKTRPSPRVSPQVQELAEDIGVAILEFLERHPGTGSGEIRQAMRLVKRKRSDLHETSRTKSGGIQRRLP